MGAQNSIYYDCVFCTLLNRFIESAGEPKSVKYGYHVSDRRTVNRVWNKYPAIPDFFLEFTNIFKEQEEIVMPVFNNAMIKKYNFPGLEHLTLAAREMGANGMEVWMQTIAPGAGTPVHRHACENDASKYEALTSPTNYT